ncbi:hypothetical protein PTSG_00111 [Salpingoeca rosetta]|uniref:RWD domain-containing protein n=1 Tax=Salpingoeca rosetta (strain ATCC 50818 / BSB-021) TaxID=946362 RepID=F2TVK1_SALR5|nr:uncharacterized protein PTSG_00111 [Salpingoeca rosetta]EGD72097.1 hypothetical protein PTSG_00111 [Salpingoeca rosetta]|eukprot:XP_004998669.1 hypothetical protein PTSG_00111 [Salpingoeca rosetta]
MANEELEDELLNLEAIFDEQLRIAEDRTSVEMTLKPDVDDDECFVRCDLRITVGDAYPNKPANVLARQIRGLSPKQQQSLQQTLTDTAAECAEAEMPAIFELIQRTKDVLEECNSSCVECGICFEAVDAETRCRTPCFHFYHRECLGRHFHFWRTDPQLDMSAEAYQAARRVTKSREEAHAHLLKLKSREPVPCPICREKLADDDIPSFDWRHIRPYKNVDIDSHSIHLSQAMVEQQRQRLDVFRHQQQHDCLISKGIKI